MAEKRGKFFFRVWPRPFSQLIPYFNPSLYVSDSKRCNACRSTNMRAVLCNEIVHTGRRFQVNFLARGGHNLTLRINTQLFRHGRLHCISNTIRVLKRRDIRATLTSGRVLCKCLIKDLANAARPASTSTFCGVRVNKFMSPMQMSIHSCCKMRDTPHPYDCSFKFENFLPVLWRTDLQYCSFIVIPSVRISQYCACTHVLNDFTNMRHVQIRVSTSIYEYIRVYTSNDRNVRNRSWHFDLGCRKYSVPVWKCGPGISSVEGIPSMVWPWGLVQIVKYVPKSSHFLKRKRIAAFVAVSPVKCFCFCVFVVALQSERASRETWLLMLHCRCYTAKLTAAVCSACSSRTMKNENSVNHKRICDRCWQKKLETGEEVDSTPAPAVRKKSLFEKANAVRSWGNRIAVRILGGLK